MISPAIALTFDDGPDPDGTRAVLDALGERDAKATFFVWGEQAARHPEIVHQTIHAGHSVQPHCWSHQSHLDMSASKIREDLDAVVALLRELGAPCPSLWRPPWGQVRRDVTRRIASDFGLELAGWTIDTTDYAGTSADLMFEQVTSTTDSPDAANAEAVVLMHDSPKEPGQWRERHDVTTTVDLVRQLVSRPGRPFTVLTHGLETHLDEQDGRVGP